MISDRVRTISTHCSEIVRIIGMKLVLTPAAYIMPVAWAQATAKALSVTLIAFPEPGLRTYRSMRRAYGSNRLDSLAMALDSLARPFRDFVAHKQLLCGRQDARDWTIIERNSDEVNRLRESEQSYIVVVGHFAREAFLGLLSPEVTPGRPVVVGQAPPERVRSPYKLRIKLQYTAFVEALSSVWGRDVEMVYIDKEKLASHTIYTRLSGQRNVILIHADAPWPSAATGTYERPFAASPNRSFATGVVELAKLARCPLVSCVYSIDRPGTVTLDWSAPLWVNNNVCDSMNHLLDPLETAVGEMPSQYVLRIGRGRRWNPTLSRWEEPAVKSEAGG
jgi:lauroyl/myristoyl acyltransferase